MRKMKKTFAVLLASVLMLAAFTVCAFAEGAAVTGITVTTPPARTVYYVGGDDYGTNIFCDGAGMVVTVSYDDGTTATVNGDDAYVDITVFDYTVGENDATVTYFDVASGTEFTTTTKVTVMENPIASVEITKMPAKTEYDLEKDVLTRENFTIEKLYETDPAGFEAMLAEVGISYEEFVQNVTKEQVAELANTLFADRDAILMIDPTGMEITVTYTDGATEVVSSDTDCITHLGVAYPIFVDQRANTVTEGKNTLYVSVMGKTADFDVTVTRAATADNTQEENKPAPAEKDEIYNPDIPKTGMGDSVTFAAVLMLAATSGSALLIRRKVEE